MRKILKSITATSFVIFALFCSAYSQIEPIDLSKPPIATPTPTPETNYFDEFDLDISNRLAKMVRLSGKVVDVHDGDTIRVLNDQKQQIKCRFNGIDAPELIQDFGNRSKQSLAEMVFGKQVTVEYDKIDKYGRNVCKILIDGKDINLEQVKRGMAWHYKKYQNEQTPEDKKAYAEAEINARNQKIGLWLQPNPTEPSAWRRGENNPNLNGVPTGSIVGNSNSMIYHTPGCSTYTKVSPQNRIVFKTETEAMKQGYRLSGACESTLPVEQRAKPTPIVTARKYETGARGGCFYLNPAGKKVYVDKSFCH